MPVPYLLLKDLNGYVDQGLAYTPDNFTVTLASLAETSFTVPSETKRWALQFSFEPRRSVFICVNGVAEVPAGNTFAPSTSMQLPDAMCVKAGDVISMISNDNNVDVSVSLYACP